MPHGLPAFQYSITHYIFKKFKQEELSKGLCPLEFT